MSPVFCWGQGERNIWHFGWNAGIDFNSGSPVAIFSPINTGEGCASICDSSGNLLFSTDGVTVYNTSGAIMGTGLFGSYTTTQSAIIIPFPNDSHKYYIFTADYQAQSHGICYSVVDMTLNGGMGGLVSINNQLVTPACEKITAVRNPNGTDFWVIVHSYPSNAFYAYPITSSGVGVPIITFIGLPISTTQNTIGCLKSSPDGQKIAAARWHVPFDPIELFDFNAFTGVLSNYVAIPCPGYSYGISFSPDNSKLYVSFNLGGGIQQFDLTIPNFQNLPYTILQNNSVYKGSLQLAPDGKIYCARFLRNSLGVINNPNLTGAACNYVDSALTLFPGYASRLGLPNFIDSYFQNFCQLSTSFEYENVDSCSINNGSINLIVDTNSGIPPFSYIWSNGATVEDLFNLTPGSYSYQVTDSSGCNNSGTVTISSIPPLTFSIVSQTDSIHCSLNGTGNIDIDINGGTSPYSYLWSNGATTQDLNNLSAGTYSLTVTDSIGCNVLNSPISFSIIQINDLQLSDSSLINIKCHDDTNGFINVTVSNGLSPNNYEWSNGATTEDLNNLTAGTYSVTVSDAGGCTAGDTVVITAPNQVIASLTTTADTVFCSVIGGTPSYHYLWSTGATTEFITNATNGTYTVTVSDINNCTALATLSIDAVSPIVGDTNFEIYPNPANGQLIIDNGQWLISEIQITDVLGRLVQSSEFKVQSPAAINVSDFSEGIYFIKLTSSIGVTVLKKFVVVH